MDKNYEYVLLRMILLRYRRDKTCKEALLKEKNLLCFTTPPTVD